MTLRRRRVGVPGENGSAGAVNVFYGSLRGLVTTGNKMLVEGTASIAGPRHAGRDDLVVVGIPGENRSEAIAILFGSVTGLASSGNESWSQNTAGVTGVAEAGDQFGVLRAATA